MFKLVDKFQSQNHGLILPFYVEKYDHQASDQFDQYKINYKRYKGFYKQYPQDQKGEHQVYN